MYHNDTIVEHERILELDVFFFLYAMFTSNFVIWNIAYNFSFVIFSYCSIIKAKSGRS